MRLAPFLRWLAVDPALAAARQPIDVIVEELARVVHAEYVFVGEILDTAPKVLRPVAWWPSGWRPGNSEGVVGDNPWGPASAGSRSSCPATKFGGYAAHPLTLPNGVQVGHICVMSRRRFSNERAIKRLLAACAPRVAGEVVCRRREVTRRSTLDAGAIQRRKRLSRDPVSDVLLREVHHRVKNNLQILASLLTLQASTSQNKVVERALFDAVTRISAIALVHSQLCESPNLTGVEMKPFVQELVRNVQRTLPASPTRVSFALDLDAITLPLKLAMPCGLLINELVTNAYQHAFEHTRSGLIEIRLTADEHIVTIIVRDDGPGLPPQDKKDEVNGLGLRLIRLLAAQQLRGDVSVARRNGTEFTVRFPHGPSARYANSPPAARRALSRRAE